MYDPNPDQLDYDYELGRLFKGRLRKKLRKAAKMAFDPREAIKLANRATHGKNSPIRKLEMGAQKLVGQYIPVAKPFMDIHNKFASQTQKAMQKTGMADKNRKPTNTRVEPATVATRLASTAISGQSYLSPQDRAALQSPDFRRATLAHLLSASGRGNRTASRALTMMRYRRAA